MIKILVFNIRLTKIVFFSTSPVKATVPKATFSGSTMQTAGTQKYYIKVSVNSFVTDATFSGRFYWTLSNTN